MKLRWDAGALEAVRIMWVIRARTDSAAARSFAVRVAEVTGRLLTLPMSGRPGIQKGMWLLPVPGAPFVFVYRVEGETVDILKMIHTADRDDIWIWGEKLVCVPRSCLQAAQRRMANRRPARPRSPRPPRSGPRHSAPDRTADSTQAPRRRHAASQPRTAGDGATPGATIAPPRRRRAGSPSREVTQSP
jgi:toxin ParE1/3/4